MPCHEVTVARGIDNGHVVLGGLKFPESNVNGDTTLTLGLQLVHHPGILEGTLARLLGLFLELLNGPLVNFTPLQSDQVTSGGGLAWIRDTFRA